ncbi:hypothetical protein A3SK_0116605 [Pseudomonas amygdali pv. tabaci str. 6605]|nr:hypothetical protein A3SK_0116605 [Pseudomonas amygdali pv. tabaci str. 6605]KIY20204.1 hypothetical protein RD00_01780 [Pseudomonas amygdali pv. tabaci]
MFQDISYLIAVYFSVPAGFKLFQALCPPQTGKVDRQQEKNKRKQCVFPVKAVQTIRPEIHLHEPVKA